MCFVALAFMPLPGVAATLTGRVVGVHDGDTIKVLDANRQQHKIRLAGIDAPESRQAFGTRSRQNLSSLVFGKNVAVEWKKRERYKRIVGKVLVDGHDMNLEQVRAGMAWWYRQYAKEQTLADRQLYELAENDARAARRGLWADPQPVPVCVKTFFARSPRARFEYHPT
jgi:endonuclease YncB( thermonuclease family)